MLNKNEAYKIIDKVLSNCKYYTMVSLSHEEKGLTRFANNQIHQNVFNEDTEVSIKIYHNKKESKIRTNLLDEKSLEEAVRVAEENLSFLPEGDMDLPELTDPKEISSETFDENLAEKYSITNRAALIKEGVSMLEPGFIAAGALTLKRGFLAMGNTKGVKRFARTDTVDFNVIITHNDGSSGYCEYTTDKADELNVVKLFETAYNKSKMGINPIEIEPGTYEVILEPLAVSELLSYTSYIGFSAKMYDLGISCFSGKIGQKAFGENITITEEINNDNIIKIPFDMQGYPRKDLNMIENGVVKEMAYDVKTAIKDNKEHTGHDIAYPEIGGLPFNMIMKEGNESLEELIKSTKKGILVSKFHYMNVVDPRQGVLTALTKDGLYLIEDGEIKSGIKNMRMTEGIFNAFNNVTGISKERTKVSGMIGVNYVPALKVKDFHFTGKTQQ